MIVREATLVDAPKVLESILKFIPQSSYRDDPIDPFHISEVIQNSIEGLNSVVAIMESDTGSYAGSFMGFAHESPLSTRKSCGEVFFWVEPSFRGHGRKLLSFVEDWAIENGCEELVLSAPVVPERAGEVFKAWKFQHTESWYRKRLG